MRKPLVLDNGIKREALSTEFVRTIPEGTSAPSNPIVGDLWLDTTVNSATLFTVISVDTTYTVGSGCNFSTLQEALDFCATLFILPHVTVTLSVADGRYTWDTVNIRPMVSGARVNITGANTYTATITSVNTKSGPTNGILTFSLNAVSTSNIAVNDYVLILGGALAGGTFPQHLWGCHKITTVNAGNFAFQVVTNGPNNTSAGVVAGTVRICKTIIATTSATAGIAFQSHATIGNITNMVVEGASNTNYGVVCYRMSKAVVGAYFGVANCLYCIYAYGSSIHAISCVVSGRALANSLGISAVEASVAYCSSTTYGGCYFGLYGYGAGFVHSYAAYVTNCTYGIGGYHCFMSLSSTQIYNITNSGIYCSRASNIYIQPSCNIYYCPTGIYAERGSRVAAYSGDTTFVGCTTNTSALYDSVITTA